MIGPILLRPQRPRNCAPLETNAATILLRGSEVRPEFRGNSVDSSQSPNDKQSSAPNRFEFGLEMPNSLEYQHDQIYGVSFSEYDQASLDEFVTFLARRFKANNIDPTTEFSGKHCLDAGCGNGRGALFMAKNGAARIDCVDISPANVRATEANLQALNAAPFNVTEGSLETLPFPDETFDFVWCNGVLMHTANPDACLMELARVLKTGGKCWIYVYGAGGLPWYWISKARSVIRDFGAELCYVAEYIDDWTVPYLRTYSAKTFSERLEDAGFTDTTPLSHGVNYDTSHRRTKFPEDSVWMGEGDLRFLLTKTTKPRQTRKALSTDAENTGKPFDPAIISAFEALFDDYHRNVEGDIVLAVMTSANIQRMLRDLLDLEGRFDVDEFRRRATDAITLAGQLRNR